MASHNRSLTPLSFSPPPPTPQIFSCFLLYFLLLLYIFGKLNIIPPHPSSSFSLTGCDRHNRPCPRWGEEGESGGNGAALSRILPKPKKKLKREFHAFSCRRFEVVGRAKSEDKEKIHEFEGVSHHSYDYSRGTFPVLGSEKETKKKHVRQGPGR